MRTNEKLKKALSLELIIRFDGNNPGTEDESIHDMLANVNLGVSTDTLNEYLSEPADAAALRIVVEPRDSAGTVVVPTTPTQPTLETATVEQLEAAAQPMKGERVNTRRKKEKKTTLTIQGQHDVIVATLANALIAAAETIFVNGVKYEGTLYGVTTPHVHAAALRVVQYAFKRHDGAEVVGIEVCLDCQKSGYGCCDACFLSEL